MPPQLALLLTAVFSVFLFRRDSRTRAVTGALWIPLLWLLLIGSRYPSQWLGAGGATDLTEGSPLDGAVFLSLELAGLVVLFQRRVSWSTVFSRNLWLVLFLAYCALAIFWSDFPFVAFKRWFKVLSHPIMVLILATEPDPREATVRLLKRAAYVLVPFSITLIKYYPALGRGFDPWSGMSVSTGVTGNKNELSCVCLLLGFFFFWHFVTTLRSRKGRERSRELVLCVAFLGMLGWLLRTVQSATAFAALTLGISIVLFLGFRFINKKHVGAYVVVAVLLVSVAEFGGGMSDALIRALGRDPTLTGRADLWEELSRFNINPVVGAGFESFWLGDRLRQLWAKHWWRPNQAHNGYLETYLNLGWIGVIVLAGWIFSTFRKTCRTLLFDLDVGRFKMGLFFIVVVYNYTEAAFKALHPMWFAFYIAAMDYPRSDSVSVLEDGRPRSAPQAQTGALSRKNSNPQKRTDR